MSAASTVPNNMFSAASWLLLFTAMAGLAFAGYEVYKRNIKPAQPQQFNFGTAPAQRVGGPVSLDQVIAAHIFGAVPVEAKPAADKPKIIDAPKTRLALRLTGVVTSPNRNNSHAMIEVERGQTSVVRVGSEIGKTGAKLDAVFGDHILIEHEGKLEKLVIERQLIDLSNSSPNADMSTQGESLSVAEFEALAKVDPSELDISKLLPVPIAAQQSDQDPAGAVTQAGLEGQVEAQRELQQQIIQEQQRIQQQQDEVDPQGQPAEKKLPGGLKKI